jgi:hypothetical protein
MAQEPKAPSPPAQDAVDKFLNEKKAFDDRRQELIKELLQQKEAAIKSFDEKLAKLGYDGARHARRSHHKHPDEKKTG